jgi:tripartite-type tricarboxylate transporter receptor subunit TctC
MRWLVAALCVGLSGVAFAQSFPSKPIRWILQFAPGGPTDVVSRVITPKLSERLGQPVVIENRTGAAGNIAADFVARAPADGYTLLYIVPALVTNPYLIKNSPDPKEFAPVIMVTSIPMVMLASTAFAPQSVPEIIAQIKAKPGTVSCGAPGSLSTIGCELLRSHSRAEMIIVNYRGSVPSLNAVMSGEINLLFDLANNALPQVKSGRVRAIASTNLKRGAGPFADLPTVAETIPGFELISWQGVVAPRGTPRDILVRLNREIAAVLALPEVRERLVATGVDVVGGSVEAFEEVLRRDTQVYAKALSDAGIKPE